jgi:hypothetical protein
LVTSVGAAKKSEFTDNGAIPDSLLDLIPPPIDAPAHKKEVISSSQQSDLHLTLGPRLLGHSAHKHWVIGLQRIV